MNEGAEFRIKDTAGAPPRTMAGVDFRMPNWLRLSRARDTVYAYTSSDGMSWTLLGSQVMSFAASVYVGASVASWGLIEIHVARGDVESAEHLWNKLWTVYVDTADVQNRASAGAVRSLIDRTIGRHQEALERAREALEWRGVLSITHTALSLSWVNALEAALAAGLGDGGPERQDPAIDARHL